MQLVWLGPCSGTPGLGLVEPIASAAAQCPFLPRRYQSFATRHRAAVSLGFMRGPLVSVNPAVVRVTLRSELRQARSSRAAPDKRHRVLETVQWPANILLFLCVYAWLLPLCFQCQPIPKPSTNLHLRFRLLHLFWIWRTVCLWTHQAHFPIFQ